VLVGHSLGGAIAIETVLARPDLVDALVLVATGARLPVPASAFERLQSDFRAECERVVRASLVREEPEIVEVALSQMLAAGPATLLADYLACADFDVRDRLQEVGVPVLVIAASEDPLTPPWLAEELARGLPDARLVVVAQASHAVMLERGRELDLLLAGFLAQVELESSRR
jgi:pimeloyl-ACP methyl ester carboxylesterase